MKRLNLFLTTVITLGLFVFTSCSSDDDSSNTQEGMAKMSVKMVDAPGDYEQVNIEVSDVVVKYQNDTEVSLNVENEIYNLLDLTGGVAANLATEYEIEAGDISQIRLVLGSNNTVVVDGTTHDLATPSAEQSGLKLNINQTLEPNTTYEYTLDFDVEESIVVQGNGGYILKPVIRLSAEANSGIISGNVILPSEDPVLVTATNATTTVSAYTDAQGNFQLYGLPGGSYSLIIESNSSLNLPPITIPDIEVVNGEIEVVQDISFD